MALTQSEEGGVLEPGQDPSSRPAVPPAGSGDGSGPRVLQNLEGWLGPQVPLLFAGLCSGEGMTPSACEVVDRDQTWAAYPHPECVSHILCLKMVQETQTRKS